MGLIYKYRKFQQGDVVPENDKVEVLPEVVIGRGSRLNTLMAEYEELNPFKPVYNKYSNKKLIDKKKSWALKDHWIAERNKYVANALVKLETKRSKDYEAIMALDTKEERKEYRDKQGIDYRGARAFISRGEWLNKYTKEEQELIATQAKFQPSLWQDFKQSLSSFNPLSNNLATYVQDDEYSDLEKVNKIKETSESPKMASFSNAMGVLAPLEIVSNVGKVVADKLLTGGDYSMGDMITGTKHDDVVASTLLDPLNIVGIGEVKKVIKAARTLETSKLVGTITDFKKANKLLKAKKEAGIIHELTINTHVLDKVHRKDQKVVAEALESFSYDIHKTPRENSEIAKAVVVEKMKDRYRPLYSRIEGFNEINFGRRVKESIQEGNKVSDIIYDKIASAVYDSGFLDVGTGYHEQAFGTKGIYAILKKLEGKKVINKEAIKDVYKGFRAEFATTHSMLKMKIGEKAHEFGLLENSLYDLYERNNIDITDMAFLQMTDPQKYQQMIYKIKHLDDAVSTIMKVVPGEPKKAFASAQYLISKGMDMTTFEKSLLEKIERGKRYNKSFAEMESNSPGYLYDLGISHIPDSYYLNSGDYFYPKVEDAINKYPDYIKNEKYLQDSYYKTIDPIIQEKLMHLNLHSPNFKKHVNEVLQSKSNRIKTYEELKDKYVGNKFDIDMHDHFMYNNERYAKMAASVEALKKAGLVNYNPKILNKHGKQLYSVVGGYTKKNLSVMIDDIKLLYNRANNLGDEFLVSSFSSEPLSKVDLSVGNRPKFAKEANIRLIINPEEKHIINVSLEDSYSGSTDRSGRGFGKGEIETKAVYHSGHIERDFKNLLVKKEPGKYDEVVVKLGDNNFRLEYDDAVPQALKDKADEINRGLDAKYGPFNPPELTGKPIEKEVLDDTWETIRETFLGENKLSIEEKGNEINLFRYRNNYNMGKTKKIMSMLPIVGSSAAYFNKKKKGGILYKK